MNVSGQIEALPHVTVLGLRYVGCAATACLARPGHRIAGVDTDEHKVGSISACQTPYYEPGLHDLVAAAVSSGSLSATTLAATAIREADIASICVGTLSLASGQLGLAQVKGAVREIRDAHLERTAKNKLIVVLRSTTLPKRRHDSREHVGPADHSGVAPQAQGRRLISCARPTIGRSKEKEL